MYQDDCRLKGVVNLVLRDKDGKVKQHKTIRNKVTRQGVAHIIGRMIDDSQDKHGNHQMPRMMSHMAIGIGAAARSGFNTYTADDYNALTFTSGASGTAVTSRRKAADSSVHDRRLQDERGQRVQLMKDTTKADDYVTLENVRLEQSGSTAIHQVSNSKSIFIFETGSGTGDTLEQLRVGLKVSRIHTSAMSGSGGSRTGTATDNSGPILTIEKIESGSSTTSPSITSSETKITLSATISPSGAQPAAGSGDVYIDVDYVNAKTLTTYTNDNPHPTHSTTLESILQGTDGTDGLGPFNNRTGRVYAGNAANIAYSEGGIGFLGINRGQIGAFYEREITYNMHLKNTDPDGVANNPNSRTKRDTTLDEAGYAVLDTVGGVKRARFPFIGAAEDKPAGRAENTSAINALSAGQDATNEAHRGTEFVQFGTAVDGIFQGELVGSSIVENPSNTIPEGYPPTENDYGQIGALHVTNAGSLTQRAQYAGSTAALNYNTSASYAPNAIAGAKRNGDRVVYVATFKENNPRPEIDYDFFAATGGDRGREPLNRIYPITEAGIFNKHINDLGIFDVGNLAYTSDQNNGGAEIAHVDRRGNATTFGGTIGLSFTEAVSHGEVDGVLTTGGQRVKASALGFTQGPITQSMLCRTTFDPVNKATADTLQITWSVQLQDATT